MKALLAIASTLLSTQAAPSLIEVEVKHERSDRHERAVGPSDGTLLVSESESYPVALENYLNAQYFGYLYFGGDKADDGLQKMKFIFDSGSSWLWVQTTACATSLSGACTASSNTYDPTKSEYFESIDGENSHSIRYGQGEVRGTIFKDRVCLDS